MGVYSLTKSSINNWVKYPNMMAGSAELSSDHLITETVLSSTAASVTFDVSTLAAQGYKHLQIRMVGRDNRATNGGNNVRFYFNGDQGANYSSHRLRGDGTSASSSGATSAANINATAVASLNDPTNAFSPSIIDILDAFATTKNKTIRVLQGQALTSTTSAVELRSGAWLSTATLASITFFPETTGSFVAGSRFSLYASKG